MLMQTEIITALLIAVTLGLIIYLVKSSLDYTKEKKKILEQERASP